MAILFSKFTQENGRIQAVMHFYDGVVKTISLRENIYPRRNVSPRWKSREIEKMTLALTNFEVNF